MGEKKCDWCGRMFVSEAPNNICHPCWSAHITAKAARKALDALQRTPRGQPR